MWNLPPPPGFVGFDPAAPMRIYVRHLPHWRQEGVTYFTTFRLADSLPQNKLRELEALRPKWDEALLRHSKNAALMRDQSLRKLMEQVEHWLDEGYGSCLLRESFAADSLERKLRHYGAQRYDLCAFVMMPNHVHLLVKPYSDRLHPLERIEQGWKAYSSREINVARGTRGGLWQQESFDRIVRDEEHLYHCIQYIGSNPARAGLGTGETRRWIRPDWAAAGWGFAE